MSKTVTASPGRKAVTAAQIEGPQFVGKTPEDIASGQELMNQVTAGYGADRDLLNQLLGQAQAFHAAGSLLQTFGVSKLAYVKENKLYKALGGTKTPNGLEFSGTWQEFCGLLGISDEKANQDIANLRTFGEEALDSMSRMGIGYRELRSFRQLPDDSKNALVELAKTGDKEAVLDMAEELLTRQAKEKEKLADKLEKKSAEYEALSENLARTNETLDQVKAKAALIPRMKPDKKANEILSELERDFLDARAALQQAVKGVDTLVAHTNEHDLDYDEQIAALATSLANQLLGMLATLRVAGIEGPAKHAIDVLKAG